MEMLRKKGPALLAIILALALPSLAAPAGDQVRTSEPVIALVGATLIDGTGGAPVAGVTVLIEGAKIKAVGPAASIKVPAGARTIDVKGKFILPGFIDCHVHTSYPFDDVQYFTDTNSIDTLRSVYIMNMLLRCGVTAVRDVGSPVEAMQAVQRANELGYIDSLRIFPCGNLITVTGGHGDGIRGSMGVDGPWEWRKAVRQMYKDGFAHIKISPTYTFEEAQAAADEAKTLGMRITSHGGGLSDTIPTTMTRIAVEAGVPCIEHVNEMEDDVLDLIAAKGVHLVPTMAIYRELYRTKSINPFLIEKRHWTQQMHETLFKKARERKILMGIGTDANGGFMKLYPGLYFDEMKYFVELGASPMETIVAATKNGAVILGREDVIGTVEAGKLADLQVLSRDPLKTFDALGAPELVIVGGKLHKFPF